MNMPGRKFSAGSGYRYGFNGKENDKDAGEGVQDYGMRIYDRRLGKFLSVDPFTKSYPWYTPYQFAGNNPIKYVDLDGAEPATPEEVQAAKTYLTQTIKPYIIKYAIQSKQSAINANILIEELQNNLKDPSTLKEKSNMGMVCGVYAFSYLFALNRPDRFVQGVASLYITGEWEYNGYVIKGMGILTKEKLGGHNPTSFIFGGAIRDRANNFIKKAEHSNKMWGVTVTSTMKHWISNILGADIDGVVGFHTNFTALRSMNDKSDNRKVQDVANFINKGGVAMARVGDNEYAAYSEEKSPSIGAGT